MNEPRLTPIQQRAVEHARRNIEMMRTLEEVRLEAEIKTRNLKYKPHPWWKRLLRRVVR